MEKMLAQRLSFIKPSPTLAMSAKAAQMKAQGINVINLSAGEPDFDTPDFIKQAATKAMADGMTKYTAVDGLPALKKAIQKKFLNDNQLKYELDELVVSTGGKQVLFNALMATINEGEINWVGQILLKIFPWVFKKPKFHPVCGS